MAWGKLFESLFTGSMVGSGPLVFAVWAYVIGNARPPGVVELNPKLMGAILGCPPADVSAAIETLCSPDPESRTKDHEGRRLLREGQFQFAVVNWAKYQSIRNDEARREQNRAAQSRWRERGGAHSKQSKPASAHVEVDVDRDADVDVDVQRGTPHSGAPAAGAAQDQTEHGGATTTPPTKRSRHSGAPRARHEAVEHDPAFLAFWNAYDHKVDKVMAAKSWVKIAPSADLAAEITKAATAYASAKPDKQYRKHPSTWLNNRCWENDPPASAQEAGIPAHGFDRNGKWQGVPRVIPKGYYETGPVDENGWPLNLSQQ